MSNDQINISASQPYQASHNPGVSTKGTSTQSQKTPPTGGVDPLVLAFYELLQATNLTSVAAALHAKELSNNAEKQQSLNARLGALQNYSVPTQINNHHTTYIAHTHWTWKFWHHGFHYTTYQKVTWTTHPNAGPVNQAQAKNQQISAERQIISDQMNVLQQIAQVGETNINTMTNVAMQSAQEDSGVLQMLDSLTFLALLRQQPQG